MADQVRPVRSSGPIDSGSEVEIGTDPTVVLDENDADRAVKFILQNNTDTEMIVTLVATPGAPGIHLLPSGGVWEETLYAGPVWARHTASAGVKDITRIIF